MARGRAAAPMWARRISGVLRCAGPESLTQARFTWACIAIPLAFTGGCAPHQGGESAGEVDATATRVVSLIPAVTEIIVSLGASDVLVARTQSEEGAELAHLPSVGLNLAPDLEVLTRARPDLVIAWSGSDISDIRDAVERGGGQVRTMSSDRLADLEFGVEQIGRWIGKTEAADSVGAEVAQALERASRHAEGRQTLKILWVVWSQPIIAAGPGTFLDDIVAILGGVNVVAGTGAPWPQVSFELLVQRDPDVIIWPESSGMFSASELADRPQWRLLPAVRKGRVLTVDGDRFHVPEPGIASAILGLAERLNQGGRNGTH